MYDKKEPDFTTLIQACKQNNRIAQEQLYESLFGRMMGLTMRYAKDQEEAKFILNLAFLKVFKNLDRFNTQRSFLAWVSSIVLHTAIDHVRKSIAYRDRQAKSAAPKEDNFALNEALSKLATEEIFGYIQQLQPMARLVFSLYEVEGFKHAEIAQQLGISTGTSKWHLSSAKKRLRQLIKASNNIPLSVQQFKDK